ncbi:MAG: WYL domain-containing protein [Ornithinimicrobium sp.]
MVSHRSHRNRQRTFRIDRVSSFDPTDQPAHRPQDFDLTESWHKIADNIDRIRTPIEIDATCAPDGINLLRVAMGDSLEIRGTTTEGRFIVAMHGHSEYGLAGHLAGLVEWLEITRPQGVRDHLADIGKAHKEILLTDTSAPPRSPSTRALIYSGESLQDPSQVFASLPRNARLMAEACGSGTTTTATHYRVRHPVRAIPASCVGIDV